jgi:hypothetical protein
VRGIVAVACAGALLLTACGADGPGTVGLYDRAPVPAVPDRTAEVTEAVDDGDYWAQLIGADGEEGTVTFGLQQAVFAQTCVDTLGADECVNGYGLVQSEVSVLLVAAVQAIVSPTVVAESQQNYAITGSELIALALGGQPDRAAPDDYQYVTFPYLITVRNGEVVEAHQIWVPDPSEL